MLLVAITVSALLCLSRSVEARYGCPAVIRGCNCRFDWIGDNYGYKTTVRCDGINGNVNDFKSNLKSLENYEIDELVINNYRIAELPDEPFTNTIIKKVTIVNSPALEYLGGRQSTKTFFDNLGNSLESLFLTNVPQIQQGEWNRISKSLANQEITTSTPGSSTSEGSGPTETSSQSSTEPPDDTPSTSNSTETESPGDTSPSSGPTETSEPSVTGNSTDVTSEEPDSGTSTEPEVTSDTPSPSDPNDGETTVETTTASEDNSTETAASSTTGEDGFRLYGIRFFKRSLKSIESMETYAKAKRRDGPVLKNLIMLKNSKTTVQGLEDFEALTGVERVIMRSIGLSQAFQSDMTGFTSLRFLDVSENKLTAFNATLPDSLTTIFLFNNQIATFDQKLLDSLDHLDQVRFIDARNNPLSCECKDIQTIVDSQRLQGVFEGTCATPPQMRGRRFGKEGCYDSQTSKHIPPITD